MDMKKLLTIVDSPSTKQSLTEGKGMQQQMIMDHYQQPQKNPVTKYRSNINEYFKVVDNEMLNTLKESQEQKRIEVKNIVNRVLERLDESKTKKDAPKPRNFVAKNAVQSGAGAHKDKKKAAKQGDVKHKGKEMELAEKAVSKAQQRFMGMVHAAQKGEKAASPEVAKVAKGMSKKAGHDFAATKHKGLPEKKTKKTDNKDVNEGLKDPKDNPCWKGYKPVGTKKKAGKTVPNCVPKESVEVGLPVKVYSNVLKKAVFGKVVEIKENRAYVQYNNTKIVMGYPIDKLFEDATTAAASTVAKAAPGVAGKMASRLVPGLGAAVGAYDAYDRAKKGDYIGAGLSGLGAVTSFIPGIGTAATMGLTGAQLARDYKMKTGAFAPDEAGQAATPAPGANIPNPTTALAGLKLQALQQELAKAGAKNKDGTPLVPDGKMGLNTQAAMSDPKFAEIVKKHQSAPAQAATPTPKPNQAAAAARTVAPAASAIAQQALK